MSGPAEVQLPSKSVCSSEHFHIYLLVIAC